MGTSHPLYNLSCSMPATHYATANHPMPGMWMRLPTVYSLITCDRHLAICYESPLRRDTISLSFISLTRQKDELAPRWSNRQTDCTNSPSLPHMPKATAYFRKTSHILRIQQPKRDTPYPLPRNKQKTELPVFTVATAY